MIDALTSVVAITAGSAVDVEAVEDDSRNDS
jgi:hypothetical protein